MLRSRQHARPVAMTCGSLQLSTGLQAADETYWKQRLAYGTAEEVQIDVGAEVFDG
jgi:hypothetical protein